MGQQTGVQVWCIFDVSAFALGPLACPLCEKYLNSVMLQLCNCFQNVLNIIFLKALEGYMCNKNSFSIQMTVGRGMRTLVMRMTTIPCQKQVTVEEKQ